MSALLSSVQLAMQSKVSRDRNAIPPITHPLGKHWNQPDPSKFVIDDTHALISQKDLDELADYTQSQPSGVYEGKCWKSRYLPVGFERKCRKCRSDALATRMHGTHVESKCNACGEHWNTPTVYFLCWFSVSPNPDNCKVNYRQILIA